MEVACAFIERGHTSPSGCGTAPPRCGAVSRPCHPRDRQISFLSTEYRVPGTPSFIIHHWPL